MKWMKCKPTGEAPIPRSAHSTTLIDDTRLYTFGGWDGNEELGDLHCFDTSKSGGGVGGVLPPVKLRLTCHV